MPTPLPPVPDRRRRGDRDRPVRSVALAVLAVAVALAGCGSSDGERSAGGTARVDATEGDDAAAAAVERVAAFRCPRRALGAGEARPGPADGGRLQVVTTVAPITSIVANVAGGRADVRGIVPEGSDSHTFEPRPSVAVDLSRADVVLLNGLQLEDPTLELAEANVTGSGQIVELGTLALDEDQYLFDDSFPEAAGRPNPHLWTNPPMAACYARTVAAVLAAADPANAQAYEANGEAYAARLDELDRLVAEATATVPAGNRQLLTYHDAYAYFAARYGWTVVGAVQVADFGDPSPKEVVALIEQVRRLELPAVFGSEVFPSDVLEEIARASGARYVDVLRDDDLPGEPGDPEHSFLGLLRFDYVTMVRELGGDPAGLEAFDAADTAPDRAVYPQ